VCGRECYSTSIESKFFFLREPLDLSLSKITAATTTSCNSFSYKRLQKKKVL